LSTNCCTRQHPLYTPLLYTIHTHIYIYIYFPLTRCRRRLRGRHHTSLICTHNSTMKHRVVSQVRRYVIPPAHCIRFLLTLLLLFSYFTHITRPMVFTGTTCVHYAHGLFSVLAGVSASAGDNRSSNNASIYHDRVSTATT